MLYPFYPTVTMHCPRAIYGAIEWSVHEALSMGAIVNVPSVVPWSSQMATWKMGCYIQQQLIYPLAVLFWRRLPRGNPQSPRRYMPVRVQDKPPTSAFGIAFLTDAVVTHVRLQGGYIEQ